MNVQAGYIYGFSLTSRKAELIKIGMTNNVERRLAELNGQLHATRMPGHLTMIHEFSYRTASTRQAYLVEQEAHRIAVAHRDSGGGEWFALSASEARSIIENAASRLNIRVTLAFQSNLGEAELLQLAADNQRADDVFAQEIEARRIAAAEAQRQAIAQNQANLVEVEQEFVALRRRIDTVVAEIVAKEQAELASRINRSRLFGSLRKPLTIDEIRQQYDFDKQLRINTKQKISGVWKSEYKNLKTLICKYETTDPHKAEITKLLATMVWNECSYAYRWNYKNDY